MENQELNEKLAIWRWGKNGIEIHGENREFIYIRGTWNKIDKEYNISLCPDFTTDLNAIFKWLVPKLQFCNLFMPLFSHRAKYKAEVSINAHDKMYSAYDNEPALALCRAIEQLIDASK